VKDDDALVGEPFASLYQELRRMAHAQLRRGGTSTLNTTALVHEAYLSSRRRDRLAGRRAGEPGSGAVSPPSR